MSDPTGPTRLPSLAEMNERVKEAVILAGACFLASFPLMYDQVPAMMAPQLLAPLTPDQTLNYVLYHVLLIFAAALLCALVGFLYSPRLQLPGLGDWKRERRWLPLYLLAGLAVVPVSYYLIDAELRRRLPGYFPESVLWALGHTLGRTLAPEVIARFGMTTIAVYLVRWLGGKGHPWPAVLAVALFGAVGSWIAQGRLGLQPGLNLFTLTGVGLAFGSNLVFGEIYLRRGLWVVLAVRLGIELKYPIYVLLG